VSRRANRHDRHRDEPGGTALVVVDMLNPYEHSEADRLAARVKETVPAIETLYLLDRKGKAALEMMERNLGAELCTASECPLE
jgi:hypothetical protein